MLGFVSAALIFDLFLLPKHHSLNLKPMNAGIAVLASIICAYVAVVVNKLLILSFETCLHLLFG